MTLIGTNIPGATSALKNMIKGPNPPSPPNAPSSYLGYGSYSGADIKVVVHYPTSARDEALREAEYTKTQIEQDLASLNSNTSTPERQQEYNDAISGATGELERLDNEISQLKALPTSKVLAELQTISWSTHRDKYPVRTFGAVYPRSFTRGHRTVAGTMVFTTFYEHVLHELLDLNLGVVNTGTSDRDIFQYTTNLPDQIPPVDISIIAANEYGAVSHMGLYGVEFVQDGGTFSIEDIFTESVVQYVARDIDPMRIAGLRKVNGKGLTEEWTMTAKGLAYQKAKENSQITRRNPFI
jgi:hypothetical protein